MLGNHRSPEDWAAIDDLVAGHTLSAEHQRRCLVMFQDLFAFIKAQVETGSLRGSLRLAPACIAVLAHPLPAITAREGEATYAAQVKARYDYLDKNLGMLLSASPRTAYDSAYAVRGSVADPFTGDANQNPEARTLLDWNLNELAKSDITYSEQSCTERIARFCTEPEMAAALERTRATRGRKPAPEVHFLVMFTQHLLSAVGPLSEGRWTYLQNDGTPVTDASARRPNSNNAEVLRKMSLPATDPNNPLTLTNVAGVDILSPEKNVITADGQENYKRLLRAVYACSKATGRRMLMRSHCGEGMPLEDDHGRLPEDLHLDPPALHLDPATRKPIHFAKASENVEGQLEAVEAFRAELGNDGARADFDNHVRIRFGHVTHATAEQAVRMKAAGIWADVCITSNVVTRAIRVLEEHSLAALAGAELDLMFGSDGEGLEHTRLAGEPEVAEGMLKEARTESGARILDTHGRAIVGRAREIVNDMLQRSQEDAVWMAARPTPTHP